MIDQQLARVARAIDALKEATREGDPTKLPLDALENLASAHHRQHDQQNCLKTLEEYADRMGRRKEFDDQRDGYCQ